MVRENGRVKVKLADFLFVTHISLLRLSPINPEYVRSLRGCSRKRDLCPPMIFAWFEIGNPIAVWISHSSKTDFRLLNRRKWP